MKLKYMSAMLVVAMILASGCSSVGGKVVERKVKKAVPGAQTKDEKIAKKADKIVGGDDEGGLRNKDK